MKKKTVSTNSNKTLFIILPLAVIVGLCIFFAIRNKTSIPDGAIVKTYEYEIIKFFDCTEVNDNAIINCECDVIMNNEHFKSKNTIIDVSCNNQAELCDKACHSHALEINE